MLNVSIVIPAWNEAERIADCLLNTIRQTVMPYEIIIYRIQMPDVSGLIYV